MDRVKALVDGVTALGFRLSGVAAEAVSSPGEMAGRVEALLADPVVRVVLLDEELFRRLPETLRRRLEERESPVFVPVPAAGGRGGRIAPEEHVARLMRRAIGYQVRIRR